MHECGCGRTRLDQRKRSVPFAIGPLHRLARIDREHRVDQLVYRPARVCAVQQLQGRCAPARPVRAVAHALCHSILRGAVHMCHGARCVSYCGSASGSTPYHLRRGRRTLSTAHWHVAQSSRLHPVALLTTSPVGGLSRFLWISEPDDAAHTAAPCWYWSQQRAVRCCGVLAVTLYVVSFMYGSCAAPWGGCGMLHAVWGMCLDSRAEPQGLVHAAVSPWT